VREQIKKLAQARNGDELALFLAVGADYRRFQETLRKLGEKDLLLPPIHEFENVMRALISWGAPPTWMDNPPSVRLPMIGDFPTPGNGPDTTRVV
jgi:hypothetical protein